MFGLLVFTLIFVVMLYKLIGFDYTDEVCMLALFGLFVRSMIKSPNWTFNKAFLATLLIFAFYTVYSFWIGSNSPGAILNDLAIQIKPYMAFFCMYHLKPRLNDVRKKLLGDVALLVWIVFLLPVGVVAVFDIGILNDLMEHPAYYGIAVTIAALCYLYGSRFTMRDKLVFFVLLSVGMLCGRSKFYGFFVMAFFVVIFFSREKQFRLSMKNILILCSMIALIGVVAWEKISLYFYQAIIGTGDVEKDMIARFVLYYTAPEILRDYFPFGSGLASYATHSSGLYYSELYTKYGIDTVWGLSKSFPNFISDTYYPSLAQFGVAGIVLFALFWVYVLRKAFVAYRRNGNAKLFTLVILIVGFLMIESTTGATFISQGGFFVMMFLGIILTEMQSADNTRPVPAADTSTDG
ncbi:MAG: O-antigen ligase domain-containing protein [Tannerella sp.]|nr:O-antigen ligase domain-containing protein [Tannerella sp.]